MQPVCSAAAAAATAAAAAAIAQQYCYFNSNLQGAFFRHYALCARTASHRLSSPAERTAAFASARTQVPETVSNCCNGSSDEGTSCVERDPKIPRATTELQLMLTLIHHAKSVISYAQALAVTAVIAAYDACTYDMLSVTCCASNVRQLRLLCVKKERRISRPSHQCVHKDNINAFSRLYAHSRDSHNCACKDAGIP
eukprot:8367-Heterococcus_DN1.PRE.4